MALEGLNTVLVQLKKTQWQDAQAFDKLVRLWPEVVGPGVAAQTRPIQLTAQGILQVAAASGAWAQNLAFERVRILVKLNAAWPRPIKDIYFSTRQWHQPARPILHPALGSLKTSPSEGLAVRLPPKLPQTLSPKDAQAAFLSWAKAVQQQANRNPTRCPICQCLTPTDELQRWGRCSLCSSRPEVDLFL